MFTFVVDYSRGLNESIKAGCYDWTDGDINEVYFPPSKEEKGQKEQSFSLYHFGKDIDSDWVIAQMEKDGKRPATLRELLAFGETNPELQRQFPIIALGFVWVGRRGGHSVAYLDSNSGDRFLSLRWCVLGWLGGCRFLAVSK